MIPIRVSVFGQVPVFQPPDESEAELLVAADVKCKHGTNYVAINQINKKRYEGESVNFKQRYGKHKSDAFNPNCKEYKSHLYNSIRKYGWKNFKWYVRQTFDFVGLEQLNEEQREAFFKAFKASYLHPCETYWIRRLGLLNPDKGYNKKESAEGGAGRVWTEEQKAKMSAAHMGIGAKPVTSREILESYEDGTQLVEFVSYASAREAAKKTGISQGNISNCCLEKRNSAGGFFWHHTEEGDLVGKHRVKHIGDVPRPPPYRRAVISTSPGGEKQRHEGGHAAKRTLLKFTGKKFDQGAISACCRGDRKRHLGYTFCYASDEEAENKKNTKKRKRN